MLNAKFDFSNRCYSQSLNATNAQNNMLEHLVSLNQVYILNIKFLIEFLNLGV